MKPLLAALLMLGFGLSQLSAKIVSRPVAYEDGGTQLEGFLVYDDAKTAAGPVPGVLVVHEWWGLNDYAKMRATQLAEMGYVAFAVDMYGKGITTTDPKKAAELSKQFYGSPLMATRAHAGYDQLLATGLVDPKRVAAIGFCFGGSTSLALAYSGAPLAGVVSFHGGLFPPAEDAKFDTRFLILHGAVDPFVSSESVGSFQHALDTRGADYQFISYSGAVHAFTNPAADKAAAAGLNGVGYNEPAARRSWGAMQVFFNEIFSR